MCEASSVEECECLLAFFVPADPAEAEAETAAAAADRSRSPCFSKVNSRTPLPGMSTINVPDVPVGAGFSSTSALQKIIWDRKHRVAELYNLNDDPKELTCLFDRDRSDATLRLAQLHRFFEANGPLEKSQQMHVD